jgi:hypothetical protein
VVKTDVELHQEVITYVTDAGSYHFFFVANEPDGASAALNAVGSVSDLNGIAFPASAFDADKPIPMVKACTDETVVVANNSVKIGNNIPMTHWDVDFERLGARVDITLHSDTDVTSTFTGVRFSNLPDCVPLTGSYTGAVTHNGTRTYAAAGFETIQSSERPEGMVWGRKLERVILPANLSTSDDHVVELELTEPGNLGTCKLGIAAAGAGKNTMPRNSYWQVTGTLATPFNFGFEIVPMAWTPANTVANPVALRWLNVSEIFGSVTQTRGAFITFSSNQPVVEIGDICLDPNGMEKSTSSMFDTSDFDYNNGSGSVTITSGDSTHDGTYTLFLKARGDSGEPLTRTIEITVENPQS